MKIKLIFIFFLVFAIGLRLSAQRVDTIQVHSDAMNRKVYNVVITPEQYSQGYAFPVLYLLHGFSDDHTTWVNRIQPRLPELANQYGVIIVCPNGDTSWYFDSYERPQVRFETFVSRELIQYMDTHYKTIARSGARAITGLSMGGHGALWLAFRHPDVFGACGSLSGGVDFRAFPDNWNIKVELGEKAANEERWNNSTVLSLVEQLKPGQAIAIDCGLDDFFLPCNMALHEALKAKKIPHDFTLRPGGHNHPYWRNAILYQMVFFSEYFKAHAGGR